MSAVFFLFLAHLSLGILAVVALVPERAGPRFFKFCSASAALLTTAGLWLLYRKHGLEGGPDAPGGPQYPMMVAWTAASLLLTAVYNRAAHFGWRGAARPLLAGAVGSGLAGLLAGAAGGPGPRALVAASDLTSAFLLGAAATAMVLGHWYLVVLDLPIAALRRLTVLLIAGLAARAAVVVLVIAGPVHAGYDDALAVASGLFRPDGIFVWMRLLFGIAGPLSLVWFIWKTVEIRSTQSATGILYVQLFLILAGELLAKYLRLTAGFPL